MTRSGEHAEQDVDERRAAAAQDLACADLVDALARTHQHRAHILDLVSPSPERTLFGRAITVSFFPTCAHLLDAESYNFGRLFDEAMRVAPTSAAHTVLVLASNGHHDVSIAGGTKLSRLTNHGVAGVVTDGRLRDFEELASEPYASWCAGEAVRWGGDEVTPHLANIPVVLNGVGVHPGQYIYCDSSGAVVIPEADIDDVLRVAHQIRDDDQDFRTALRDENTAGRSVRER